VKLYIALRRAILALFLIWLGCTKPPPPVFERNNSILSILEILPESFHLPTEFAGLVKSSSVSFDYVAFPQPIAEDWSFNAAAAEPSIYTNVVSDGKSRKVFMDEPPIWLLELYQLGERYANVENNLEEARRTLNRAIVSHPKYFKSYTVYGKVLVQKERWNEAMPFLQKALELNPLLFRQGLSRTASL
jgi:tetratricopeptide (TPR) repeat protein